MIMLAFEVFVNGRKITLAGADDLGVLSTIVNAVGKLGQKSSGTETRPKGYNLRLSVGGLTGRKNNVPNDYLRWAEMEKLKIGDEILVRVCRVNLADPPSRTCPAEPKRSERAERDEFKWVKSRYLELRKKYEAPRVDKSFEGTHRKRRASKGRR